MTMSSRPRVLTEQDAGSMDTLIRRGEQAATVAEQKAQQLQNAAADLEQVKGTIPAAAQSAATLATAQAKSTLDAAANSAAAAAAQATLALATLPKFRSVDVNNPTAPTQVELDANPNGLGGTRLTADGATQPLRWTPHTLAGAWVTVGAPTATAPQVQEARDLAQEADTKAESAAIAAELLSTGLSVPDTSNLTALTPGTLDTLIVQHPERGGIFLRDANQTGAANKITRFSVGGVFFSRSTPPREWRLDHMDIAGDFGGDVGAALNHLVSLQRDGDRLIFGAKRYRATTTWRQGVPVVFHGEGARLEAYHNGIAADLYPEGTLELAGLGPRYFSGDQYGGGIPYSGVLPRVERTFRANGDDQPETAWVLDYSQGIRVTNHYYSRLDMTQGIIGFSTGLSLYADRKNLGIRDVGTSYCDFQLGRMENHRNIIIGFAPNGAATADTPNHYVTQNTLRGGSLSTGLHWAAGTDWAASTHIEVNGGNKPGMCDNTVFDRVSMEGYQRVGINYQGYVHGFEVRAARMEMPAVVTPVSYGPQTMANRTQTSGLANNSGATDPAAGVIDLGQWNEVESTDFPRGTMIYRAGKWEMRGKLPGTDAGLRNWEPRSLDEEPVLRVTQTVATVTTSPFDLRTWRRISLTIVAGGGNGQDAGSAAPIYNNLIGIDLTRAPEHDGWAYEIELVQDAFISTIGSAWVPEFIRFGAYGQPVPRHYGRDLYRIRVHDGVHRVYSHEAT